MSNNKQQDLYDLSKKKSVECFVQWCQEKKPSLNPEQRERLSGWLNLFDKTRNNTEPALEEMLGGGVWRCDYTRGQIYYDHLWTEFDPLKKDIESQIKPLMQIPFGKATIGYVVDKAALFPGGYYIVADTEKDMRGSFALEDRYLGQVNAITYPIDNSLGDHTPADVQAIFCLFHPVPELFDLDLVRRFIQVMQPIGQQLLRVWANERYQRIFSTIHRSFSAHDPSTSLDERSMGDRVMELAKELSNVSQQPSVAHGQTDTGFAWVGVLNCGPTVNWHSANGHTDSTVSLGTASLRDHPLLTTWMEPESFIRARQLTTIDRCMLLHGLEFIEHSDAAHNLTPHYAPCEWSVDIQDWVIPLVSVSATGAKVLEGQVRLHVSCPRSSWPRISLREPATILRGLDIILGNMLAVFRRHFRDNPVAVKLERELERLLFEQLFKSLFGRTRQEPRREFQETLIKVATTLKIDTIPRGPTQVDVADAIWELRKVLRPTLSSLKEVVALSYLSFDRELVLSKAPNGILDDRRLLRDFQLALTALAVTSDPGDLQKGLEARWTGKEDVSGLIIHTKGSTWISWYLHMPFTSITMGPGSARFDQQYDSLRITTDNLNAAMLHVQLSHHQTKAEPYSMDWHIKDRWPMVRAWRVNDRTVLDEHLRKCRVCRETANNRRELEVIWHPKDGEPNTLRDVISLSLPKNPTTRTRLVNKIAAGGVYQFRDRTILPVEKALWTLLLAEAPDEVFDLTQFWALPVQVLGHVYCWLLIGARHNTLPGEFHSIDFVIRALNINISRMIRDLELVTLRRVFDDDLQRRDFSHGFRIPVQELLAFVESALEGTIDHKGKSEIADHAYRLDRWCIWWLKEVAKQGGRATLSGIVKKAVDLVETHRFTSADEKGKMATFYRGFRKQISTGIPATRLRLDSDEQFNRLLMVCADVIINAAKHSDYSSDVTIQWDSTRGILSVTNPIAPGDHLELLENHIPKLNSCLRVPPDSSALSIPLRKGLRNILIAANRLRLGVQYDVHQVNNQSFCSVLLFLRRLVESEE